MRRFWILLFALLFVFASSALAERTVYADQGGVAVFMEDGKVGLVDAHGDVILPAEYDEIHPFVGQYAIIEKKDKLGVVRRDGSIALSCEWNWIGANDTGLVPKVYDDLDMAMAYNDWYYQYLIDLNDGRVLLEGRYLLWADGNRIFRSSYGDYDYWGNFAPPFHTDIYDLDMNLCLSLDADVEGRLGDHWFLITEEEQIEGIIDRECSIVDERGNRLIDRITVRDIGEDGEAVYTRRLKNPLTQRLEAMGYYKKNVKWILHNLLGIDLEKAKQLAAMLMDDRIICGIWKPDGENVEIAGVDICPRDSAGLYRVNTGDDRWGFIDSSGAWVISPIYAEAHPFVDGTAVVSEDGRRYIMIDTGARQVGRLEWEKEEPAFKHWNGLVYDGTIVPVFTSDGFRLANRQGEYISEEVFPAMRECWTFKYRDWLSKNGAVVSTRNFGMLDEKRAVVADSEKHLKIIRNDGREELNINALDWRPADNPDLMLVCTWDGLWGVMDVTGANAGKWRVDPCYTIMVSETGRIQTVRYPDKTCAFMDYDGNLFGPTAGHWGYDE